MQVANPAAPMIANRSQLPLAATAVACTATSANLTVNPLEFPDSLWLVLFLLPLPVLQILTDQSTRWVDLFEITDSLGMRDEVFAERSELSVAILDFQLVDCGLRGIQALIFDVVVEEPGPDMHLALDDLVTFADLAFVCLDPGELFLCILLLILFQISKVIR